MHLVSILKVKPGMTLGRGIYDADGRVLLANGTKLSTSFISRLQKTGLHYVYIENPLINDVVFQETVKETTKLKALKHYSSILHDLNFQQTINAKSTKAVVNQILEDLTSNKDVLVNLSDIQCHDSSTYSHSVSVAIIALVFGLASDLDPGELELLGIGALLHDVGKAYIPNEILTKPAQLTAEERQIINKHCYYGYDILIQNRNVEDICALAAYQHHERVDGEGYPRQLTKERIHKFALITAIADVYEALTNNRPYRLRFKSNEAYEFIMAHSGTHFDMDLVKVFVKHIAIFPNGSQVVLSNCQKGYVVGQNKGFPSRPIVRVFWYNDEQLPSPVEYNLLEQREITIVHVED